MDRREEYLQFSRELEQAFPGEQAQVFLDRAAYFSERGKTSRAISILQEAQSRDPQNLEVRRRIGLSLIQERKWPEAEAHYLRMREENILLDEAYLRLGLIKLSQGYPDQAKEYFWKALAEDPDSLAGRYWLVRLAASEWTPRVYAQVGQVYLDFTRSQETGLLDLGDIEVGENRWDRALACYQEVVDKRGDDEVIPAALRLAQRMVSLKQVEGAQIFLEDLQKRYPRNQKITRELIRTYGLNKAYGEAIKQIDNLLKLEDPLDPVLNVDKARYLEKWNKHSASQHTFAVLLSPTVDQIFWEKLQAGSWIPRLREYPTLKTLMEERDPRSLDSFL